MLTQAIPQPPERMYLSASDLETRMDTGAIAFSKYFKRIIDANGWSHPQMVALCKLCTDGKAWLHNSQIAGLLKAGLKSPGPRSFVALEYLFKAIDEYQKNGEASSGVRFGKLTHLVEHAEIMRDPNGNPATLGYLVEVFTGLREVPIDISSLSFSEKHAEIISVNAGRLVRKLMAIEKMDPIDDAIKVASRYSGSQEQKAVFVAIITGNSSWLPEEVEEGLFKLAKLLREAFEFDRTASELREELLTQERT